MYFRILDILNLSSQERQVLKAWLKTHPEEKIIVHGPVYTVKINTQTHEFSLEQAIQILRYTKHTWFIIDHMFNEGAFGSIWIPMGRLHFKHHQLTIEAIDRAYVLKAVDTEMMSLTDIKAEASLMSLIYNGVNTHVSDLGENAFFVQPLLSPKGESLDDFLYDKNNHISKQWRDLKFQEVLLIILAITRQVRAFHELGYIHNDLHPCNILFDPKTKQIRLCDFGLAKMIAALFMYPGRWSFASPEVLLKKKNEKLLTDASVDIYFLGLVFGILLCNNDDNIRRKQYFVDLFHHDNYSLDPIGRSAVARVDLDFSGIYDRPDLSKAQAQEVEIFLHEMVNPKPKRRPRIDEVESFFTQKASFALRVESIERKRAILWQFNKQHQQRLIYPKAPGQHKRKLSIT